MDHRIVGDNLQMAILELDPGDRVFAEAGALVYMSGNVEMSTGAKGGIMKGLKRMFAGESFFMTEFEAHGGRGLAAFAGNAPGRIQPIELGPGETFVAEKDAFLCASDGLDMDITFQKKLGSGFFGGEGFILQRMTGPGTVFLHAVGDFVTMELEEGQSLKVEAGCVVGFAPTVDYDIQYVGDIKSALFGGEGFFLVRLTGPGRIILQSMTLQKLATALRPYFPQQGGTSGSGGVQFHIG